MATVPCTACHAPARGKAISFYPALLANGTRHAQRRYFCVEHARGVVSAHHRDWRDLALHDLVEETTSCYGCGELFDTNAALTRFFCTVYLDGKNRRDYKSQYCPTCVSAIVSEFEIDV